MVTNNELGGCPRIAIFAKIEAYEKNYRRRHEVSALGVHIVDIPRIIFSGMTKSLGKRAFSDSFLGKICGLSR